jgi:hypothetical protein
MQQFTLARVDGDALGLPVGWYVERYETVSDYDDGRRIQFRVFQEGGTTWEDGTPRPEIDVDMNIGGIRYGSSAPPEVSWPSTSDRRPDLARALAAALMMAAEEAEDEVAA